MLAKVLFTSKNMSQKIRSFEESPKELGLKARVSDLRRALPRKGN